MLWHLGLCPFLGSCPPVKVTFFAPMWFWASHEHSTSRKPRAHFLADDTGREEAPASKPRPGAHPAPSLGPGWALTPRPPWAPALFSDCPSPDGCRFVGRPGDYVYIFRSFRMEEVSE